jgi:hypothetical protein
MKIDVIRTFVADVKLIQVIGDLLLVTIIKAQVCYEERIPLDTKLRAYHHLQVPNYWPSVASHMRPPHHDSALNRSTCIPRG